MATTTEENTSKQDASQPAEGEHWTAEIIMGVLAVLLILVSVLAGGKKSKTSPPIDEGVRAVVVPTADRARTIVVPPCGSGTRITSRNLEAQLTTPGATVVRLAPAARARMLLIPRCAASTSSAGGKQVAQVPSSLFVFAMGATTDTGSLGSPDGKKTKTIAPRTQVIVPTASEADTVVVPPCTGVGREEQATVLTPRPESPQTLLAPRC